MRNAGVYEVARGAPDRYRSQPTASGDGGALPPCGASAVMIRAISVRSAGDGKPHPGS
jgi:hypothetical protein